MEFKTAKVKEYVSRMHAMIEATKKTELEEAQKQQQMRLAHIDQLVHMEGGPIAFGAARFVLNSLFLQSLSLYFSTLPHFIYFSFTDFFFP